MALSSAYKIFEGHATTDIYITGKDTVLIQGVFKPNPHDFILYEYDSDIYNYHDIENSKSLYLYNINIPFENGVEIRTENTNI